jgi:hypothetical protein
MEKETLRLLAPVDPEKFKKWLSALPLDTLQMEYAIAVDACERPAPGRGIE